MNNSLDHYIGYFENVISEEFCKKIISEYSDREWQSHIWQNMSLPTMQYDTAEPEVFYLKNENNKEIKNTLGMFSMMAIDRYQNDKQIPVGLSKVHEYRINRYNKNCFMRNHIDHIYDLFDGENRGIPVLSIIINLNNEYQGGEIVFFDKLKFSLKTGDILVFPSNFLFPHSVQPITDGVRYSAVSWAY
jgi:predicted 2-oxoglutarate/Fe(II)-dependent dioxygenase YbiX